MALSELFSNPTIQAIGGVALALWALWAFTSGDSDSDDEK